MKRGLNLADSYYVRDKALDAGDKALDVTPALELGGVGWGRGVDPPGGVG